MKRKTASQRGYGGKWRKARLLYLADNPLCVFCSDRGIVEAATVVDHIIPHKGDQKLFWKQSNWQPLCTTCHNKIKKIIENGGETMSYGTDGWPVDMGGGG